MLPTAPEDCCGAVGRELWCEVQLSATHLASAVTDGVPCTTPSIERVFGLQMATVPSPAHRYNWPLWQVIHRNHHNFEPKKSASPRRTPHVTAPEHAWLRQFVSTGQKDTPGTHAGNVR